MILTAPPAISAVNLAYILTWQRLIQAPNRSVLGLLYVKTEPYIRRGTGSHFSFLICFPQTVSKLYFMLSIDAFQDISVIFLLAQSR